MDGKNTHISDSEPGKQEGRRAGMGAMGIILVEQPGGSIRDLP